MKRLWFIVCGFLFFNSVVVILYKPQKFQKISDFAFIKLFKARSNYKLQTINHKLFLSWYFHTRNDLLYHIIGRGAFHFLFRR
jgi:hypothetical protein